MQTDIDMLAARLAAGQHGVIGHRQLVVAGATRAFVRHRVEDGRWLALNRRAFVVAGTPSSWRQRLLASVLGAGEGTAVSHRAAAALWAIPGFAEGPLELTVPRPRTPDLAGVTVHRRRVLLPGHVKILDGLPVTSVARTVFDLCGIVHPKRAERALDNCLSRKMVTVPALWRVHGDLAEHGRAGTVLLRELLLARGKGYVAPASELEARLLDLLEKAGLPAPAREVNVGDSDRWVGRVELVYRDAKVLIEADSRLHHTSKLDREADLARDNRLVAAGWRVLRITWEMLRDRPDEVVSLVRSALHSSS
ncbi:MAG: DUF559 domain-containing protein [Actinobacteria bacterium]|nr:MAG: DUF559 domain-containing protein [Actinomycetota bacterium]